MGPFIDLEAKRRIEALEDTNGAAAIGFTVDVDGDWPDPNPTTVDGALNGLGARVQVLEDADAGDLTYTPTTGGDWPDPDPADVEGALDGLAGRVKTLEDAPAAPADAGDLTYTPTTGGDWPDPDPTDVEGALDGLAGRAQALEALGYLVLAAVAAAENLNVIAVTITCSDHNGDAVAAGLAQIDLLNADLTLADDASQAMDITTGTVQSATIPGSDVALLVQADAGQIVIDVTDKTAALAGDRYLRLTPVDRIGPVKLFKITFA